ncbi:hypothetical protein ACK5FK_001710 [Campylobacter coli]
MENKQYIYNLPNESNEKQKLETNTNSIIIVGANGSGKSKLGAWMGKNNNHTHIIASKRLTYISENLSIWLETDVQKQDDYTDIKNTQDDYDDTISILFRQQIKELCSRDKNKPFKTRIDYLFEIFNKVTQKELNINKNRFCINSKDKSYDLTNFRFEEIKNYLFEEKFKNCLEKQILENLKSEIKHKLNTIDINLKTSDKIKEKINSIEEFINFDDLHKNISNKFNSVYKEKNYNELLKVFNKKEIYKDNGFLNKVGRTEESYIKEVLKLLKENKKLRKEVLKYINLPEI